MSMAVEQAISKHCQDLTEQAEIIIGLWRNYIDSGSRLPPGEYIIDEPCNVPIDGLKTKLLLQHLKEEYPEFNKIDTWAEMIKTDTPLGLLRILQRLTLTRTFNSRCEICEKITGNLSSQSYLAKTMIDKYLQYHRYHSTEATVKMYGSVLERFAAEYEYLPTRPEQIELFIEQFPGDVTRYNYYKIIRYFYKWLNERHNMANPTDKMKAPRVKKRIVPSLALEELKEVLAQPLSQRDRAAIMIMAGCGLRVGEVIGLTFNHIGDDVLTVPTWSKTGERIVPLAPRIRDALLALKDGHGGDEPIFWGTHPTQPLGHAGFLQIVKRAFHDAGIEGKRASPHTLRHTFCRIWAAQGGNAATLKEIMGHAELSTTQQYIALSAQDLLASNKRFNPFITDSDERLTGHDDRITPNDDDKSL